MTTVTRNLGTPRAPLPVWRRYAPGLAILLGTAAFVVGMGLIGLWMLRSG